MVGMVFLCAVVRGDMLGKICLLGCFSLLTRVSSVFGSWDEGGFSGVCVCCWAFGLGCSGKKAARDDAGARGCSRVAWVPGDRGCLVMVGDSGWDGGR